ncbi:MAG TPA: hypothetical protein VFI62_04445, partial [Burkholderiales bacterium]|nr:hypothetical protein [Burkholderiales bacterium]
MNTEVAPADSSPSAAASKWASATALQLGMLVCGVVLSLLLCYLALQRYIAAPLSYFSAWPVIELAAGLALTILTCVLMHLLRGSRKRAARAEVDLKRAEERLTL